MDKPKAVLTAKQREEVRSCAEAYVKWRVRATLSVVALVAAALGLFGGGFLQSWVQSIARAEAKGFRAEVREIAHSTAETSAIQVANRVATTEIAVVRSYASELVKSAAVTEARAVATAVAAGEGRLAAREAATSQVASELATAQARHIAPEIAKTKEFKDAARSAVGALAIPPGTIVAYGGTTEPTGWLFCDGRPLSSTQAKYAQLFDAIRTAHGAGCDPKTRVKVADADFNLPDLRGRFLRGVTGDSLRDPDVAHRKAANTGGLDRNNVGSIQPDALRNHRHSHGDLTAKLGVKGDSIVMDLGSRTFHGNVVCRSVVTSARSTEKGGVALLGDTGNVTYEQTASETRPKNAYVNFIIKY